MNINKHVLHSRKSYPDYNPEYVWGRINEVMRSLDGDPEAIKDAQLPDIMGEDGTVFLITSATCHYKGMVVVRRDAPTNTFEVTTLTYDKGGTEMVKLDDGK